MNVVTPRDSRIASTTVEDEMVDWTWMCWFCGMCCGFLDEGFWPRQWEAILIRRVCFRKVSSVCVCLAVDDG